MKDDKESALAFVEDEEDEEDEYEEEDPETKSMDEMMDILGLTGKQRVKFSSALRTYIESCM